MFMERLAVTNKILLIFGTRPEAIKMAPLYFEFKKHKNFDCECCVTGQHREMLDQVLDFFEISPKFDLNLMKPNQTLFDITSRGLKQLESVLEEYQPDYIVVQGDTTTAFIGALAGFYKKIHVIHIEAGLRSGNKYSPFPEEINRILAGHIADIHFAPTEQAVLNLKNEGIENHIYNVGNTVIDALKIGLQLISEKKLDTDFRKKYSFIDYQKKIILVTGHRRESFGKPFENICNAIKHLKEKYDDIEFVYPVHLNPNVRTVVQKILGNIKGVHLIEPLPYPEMIWLMNTSHIVLTDSGGIQEEAPSLGKPVLVMRNVTERMEGVHSGTAKLVGTEFSAIVKELSSLLENKEEYSKMSTAVNPYGDGLTASYICSNLLSVIGEYK